METYNKYSNIPYQDLSTTSDLDRTKMDPQKESNLNNKSDLINYQDIDPNLEKSLSSKGSWINIGSWLNNRFTTGIYYSIKNQSYEVYIMYVLIIIVLIILMAMTIDSIYHYDHTLINLRRAEIVRNP